MGVPIVRCLSCACRTDRRSFGKSIWPLLNRMIDNGSHGLSMTVFPSVSSIAANSWTNIVLSRNYAHRLAVENATLINDLGSFDTIET